MFVRWQLYHSQALDPNTRKRHDKHTRLKAILVESVRVDGQPRQRHIAFLGSLEVDGKHREGFWYRVTRRLDQLGNQVSAEQRQGIEAAIAKKIGGGQLLTKAQLAQYDIESEQLLASLVSSFQHRPRG